MKPELLSPAGSLEALRAAVENGADAVYLGGRLFNARQFASNFNDSELEEAIDYAHLRNCKIYLTLNTLLKNDELIDAIDYANKVHGMGIDAVITQDLGFASLIKKNIPSLELHASTQMTTYNKEGANHLKTLGFKRIVLARELPAKEISQITKSISIDTEVFVHGALCVCYSGQCLLSSSIGSLGSLSRSGNRGTCAQPCRLKYKLFEKSRLSQLDSGHLLSTRDICGIDNINDLMTAGISSLKIEGRMKSPEYVGIVTAKYRKLLDTGKLDETDKKQLLQTFNRGGLYPGYLNGRDISQTVFKDKPKNMGTSLGTVIGCHFEKSSVTIKLTENIFQGDGIEILTNDEKLPGGIVTGITVNNKLVKEAFSGQTAELTRINFPRNLKKGLSVIKTSDKMLNVSISETFKENSLLKKIPIFVYFTFKQGFPMQMTLAWENLTYTAASQVSPECARTSGITAERLTEQLAKFDNYPFTLASLPELIFEENLFIPISEINKLRRTALEGLKTEICNSAKTAVTPLPKLEFNFPQKSSNEIRLSVMSYTPDIFDRLPEKAFKAIDRIILPLRFFNKSGNILNKIKENGIEITALLPTITRENPLIGMDLTLADSFMISTLGSLSFVKEHDKPIYGNIGLNVYNAYTAHFLKNELDFKCITPSPELESIEYANLSDIIEPIIYGKYPVMTSEHCPVGAHYKCTPCPGKSDNHSHFLQDRLDEQYPIICTENCIPEILSAKPIDLRNQINALKRDCIYKFRINIFQESPKELEEIIWEIKR